MPKQNKLPTSPSSLFLQFAKPLKLKKEELWQIDDFVMQVTEPYQAITHIDTWHLNELEVYTGKPLVRRLRKQLEAMIPNAGYLPDITSCRHAAPHIDPESSGLLYYSYVVSTGGSMYNIMTTGKRNRSKSIGVESKAIRVMTGDAFILNADNQHCAWSASQDPAQRLVLLQVPFEIERLYKNTGDLLHVLETGGEKTS